VNTYQIWSTMKTMMAYKNVMKRVLKLHKSALLLRIDTMRSNPHASINYKVNKKLFKRLIDDRLETIEKHKQFLIRIQRFTDD
jgi:hypothetical protein